MPAVQAWTAASWALEPAPASLPDRFWAALPPPLLPPLDPPLSFVSSPQAAAVTASDGLLQRHLATDRDVKAVKAIVRRRRQDDVGLGAELIEAAVGIARQGSANDPCFAALNVQALAGVALEPRVIDGELAARARDEQQAVEPVVARYDAGDKQLHVGCGIGRDSDAVEILDVTVFDVNRRGIDNADAGSAGSAQAQAAQQHRRIGGVDGDPAVKACGNADRRNADRFADDRPAAEIARVQYDQFAAGGRTVDPPLQRETGSREAAVAAVVSVRRDVADRMRSGDIHREDAERATHKGRGDPAGFACRSDSRSHHRTLPHIAPLLSTPRDEMTRLLCWVALGSGAAQLA
jgi:hypothetical protein